MLTVTALLNLLAEETKLAALLIAKLPPETVDKAVQRHFDRTEWMQALLAKFSDRLEKIINKEAS